MRNLRTATKLQKKVKPKLSCSGKPAMSLIFIIIICWIFALIEGSYSAQNDVWPLERPEAMPAIQSLEVMCGKDHMDVHLQFTQPFEGIVSSKGQYGDPRCVYVPPSTGKTFYTFRIGYARCGTKPDLNGQFYENTVVVQYDKDLLEVWDEAKRLRCEWYNDYEKTASKPPMVIADLDVIQLDFRGDNVDCWMEIQHGKGPWAPPVSGIVPLGSTLTLVVAINDYRGEFDMRVKSCAASDGGGHIIQLSDEHGCVLRPKMISRFLKAKIADERASVITYAFFHAFKFPDALSVHIKCKVEICRHGCLDHCQLAESLGEHPAVPHGPHAGFDEFNTLKRQDTNVGSTSGKDSSSEDQSSPATSLLNDLLYDDKPIDDVPNETSYGEQNPAPLKSKLTTSKPDSTIQAKIKEINENLPHSNVLPMPRENTPSNTNHMQSVLNKHHTLNLQRDPHERFPHGPRKLKDDVDVNLLGIAASSNRTSNPNHKPSSSFQRRRRRSFVVSDKEVSNANVGVSGLYEVISEADLAFTPDKKQEAVTVFQGSKLREEVVYGICLPVQGFSAIFIVMALCAILSAVVAGFLLYRYQVQRQKQKVLNQQQARMCHQRQYAAHVLQPTGAAEFAMNSIANWMAFRLIGSRPVTNQRQTPSEQKS